MTTQRYSYENLEHYLRILIHAYLTDFAFIDDTSYPHSTHFVHEFLESKDIKQIYLSGYSPHVKTIENIWQYIR